MSKTLPGFSNYVLNHSLKHEAHTPTQDKSKHVQGGYEEIKSAWPFWHSGNVPGLAPRCSLIEHEEISCPSCIIAPICPSAICPHSSLSLNLEAWLGSSDKRQAANRLLSQGCSPGRQSKTRAVGMLRHTDTPWSITAHNNSPTDLNLRESFLSDFNLATNFCSHVYLCVSFSVLWVKAVIG